LCLGELIEVFLSDPVLVQPAQWYSVIIKFHFYCKRKNGIIWNSRGESGSHSIRSEGILFEFDRCESGDLIAEVLFSPAS